MIRAWISTDGAMKVARYDIEEKQACTFCDAEPDRKSILEWTLHVGHRPNPPSGSRLAALRNGFHEFIEGHAERTREPKFGRRIDRFPA
jgi:hypothetical protein